MTKTDDRKQYYQDWYEANAKRILARAKEKIVCECGAEIARSTMHKHRKSKYHQRMLAVHGPVKIE